jgi:hypothetical protein
MVKHSPSLDLRFKEIDLSTFSCLSTWLTWHVYVFCNVCLGDSNMAGQMSPASQLDKRGNREVSILFNHLCLAS